MLTSSIKQPLSRERITAHKYSDELFSFTLRFLTIFGPRFRLFYLYLVYIPSFPNGLSIGNEVHAVKGSPTITPYSLSLTHTLSLCVLGVREGGGMDGKGCYCFLIKHRRRLIHNV